MAAPGNAHDGWVWTLVCEDVVAYAFSESRSAATPQRLLRGTSGVLVVDGYAALQTLCHTCLLHDINPYEYLQDILVRVGHHPASRLDELPPWHGPTAMRTILPANSLPADSAPAARAPAGRVPETMTARVNGPRGDRLRYGEPHMRCLAEGPDLLVEAGQFTAAAR